MSTVTSHNIDPKSVDSPELAMEYNSLRDEVYNENINTVICSDGTILSLRKLKHRFLDDIKHLKKEDQEKILENYTQFQKKIKMMGVLKQKIFGRSDQQEGIRGNILEPVRSELLEWFGRLYSVEEIQKKLVERGFPVNIAVIRKFKQKNKEDIDRLQEQYELDWKSVPITRKRSRLDQYSYIYNTIKDSFEKTNGVSQLPYSKEMRAILEQVRKEVEGDNIKLTVDGKIDIGLTIEANKSVEQLYSQINFMALLIGRVSARFKLNPAVLHYQLINSWYSEYTGFKKNDKFQELTPEYPSKIVYNWETIEEKYKEKVSLYERLSKTTDITDVTVLNENKEKKKTMKELMREKIKQLDGAKERL